MYIVFAPGCRTLWVKWVWGRAWYMERRQAPKTSGARTGMVESTEGLRVRFHCEPNRNGSFGLHLPHGEMPQQKK